jgi:DMSO reductase anchor subunit
MKTWQKFFLWGGTGMGALLMFFLIHQFRHMPPERSELIASIGVLLVFALIPGFRIAGWLKRRRTAAGRKDE